MERPHCRKASEQESFTAQPATKLASETGIGRRRVVADGVDQTCAQLRLEGQELGQAAADLRARASLILQGESESEIGVALNAYAGLLDLKAEALAEEAEALS